FSHFLFFFSFTPPPPRSTLFPYTTLFRSQQIVIARVELAKARVEVAAHVLKNGVREKPPQLGDAPNASGANTPGKGVQDAFSGRSEEHTSELQSLRHLVCRLLLEKKKKKD